MQEIEEEVDRGEGVAGFVLAAAVFNLGIWAVMGPQKAEEVRSRGRGGCLAAPALSQTKQCHACLGSFALADSLMLICMRAILALKLSTIMPLCGCAVCTECAGAP